jgi:hypothetical protein
MLLLWLNTTPNTLETDDLPIWGMVGEYDAENHNVSIRLLLLLLLLLLFILLNIVVVVVCLFVCFLQILTCILVKNFLLVLFVYTQSVANCVQRR